MMYSGKTVSLIMAADDYGVIGTDSGLPWHDAEDLKWFKHQTLGKAVIFGARTFETLPKMEGRYVTVLSKTAIFKNPHKQPLTILPSLLEAVAMAQTKEVFIAGGRSVYKAAIEQGIVDRFLIARIRGQHDGNVFTPFDLPWTKAA